MTVSPSVISKPKTASWFAGANSRYGFIGRFDQIFDTEYLDHVYIISGGPGTGKSRLIRKTADAVLASGGAAELFYCSSDPDSLDGAILKKNEKKIGILDGTPPHGRIPKRPGTKETLIDLGAFWDRKALQRKETSIREWEEKKQDAYLEAYSALALCGQLRDRERQLRKKSFLSDKAYSALSRLLKRIKTEQGSMEERYTETIGMTGVCRLPTLNEISRYRIGILDAQGISDLWFSMLTETLDEQRIGYIRVPLPLDPGITVGVLLKGSLIAFFPTGSKTAIQDECLNMQRFLCKESFKSVRKEIHDLKVAERKEEESAIFSLQRAKNAHFSLESVYSASMDFSSKERYTERLIQSILQEID